MCPICSSLGSRSTAFSGQEKPITDVQLTSLPPIKPPAAWVANTANTAHTANTAVFGPTAGLDLDWPETTE